MRSYRSRGRTAGFSDWKPFPPTAARSSGIPDGHHGTDQRFCSGQTNYPPRGCIRLYCGRGFPLFWYDYILGTSDYERNFRRRENLRKPGSCLSRVTSVILKNNVQVAVHIYCSLIHQRLYKNHVLSKSLFVLNYFKLDYVWTSVSTH